LTELVYLYTLRPLALTASQACLSVRRPSVISNTISAFVLDPHVNGCTGRASFLASSASAKLIDNFGPIESRKMACSAQVWLVLTNPSAVSASPILVSTRQTRDCLEHITSRSHQSTLVHCPTTHGMRLSCSLATLSHSKRTYNVSTSKQSRSQHQNPHKQ
jgi:hypothetical protein